jgi:choline dehydrogenase-like flavoprotein
LIRYDVCVVGSGPGGGIAAYALAKAGLKVALLEAGPSLRAGIDYGQHVMPWEATEQIATGEFVLNTAFGRRERNHFTPVGDRPEHGWLKAVGGRSLCWAGHSLRFGPGDYKQWPIAYDEVAPYYSRAEKYMGVYGNKDGLWNLPDGEFSRPIGMRCGEWLLHRGVQNLKAKGAKMELVQQRKAMLTDAHPSGRALCHYCGKCNGCCVDAKYTSANTPIPQGLRTGNLTLLTEAMMTRIVMDASGRRVSGVEYTKPSGATERVDCRALVLACNSIETPRQLLLNTSRQFPNGLANSSGQVGRNLTSHFGLSVTGFFPELRNRPHLNDESAGIYQSLLTGLYWDKPNPNFEGTYQVQNTAGWALMDLPVRNVRGFGRGFKRELREKCAASARMNMQGTILISPRKFVDLDPDKKDRYGLNVSRIHLHYEDSDVAMAQDMVNTCEEIIRAGRGEVVSTPGKVTTAKLEIDFNHWVGTVRMGNDPKTSVVDRFGRSHDVPNLFVGDASVFPAYPEKNPTLTNIALSWRMSDHLVELARKGELS